MSNSDKNNLSFQTINYADTISEFMEKVNNNFTNILNNGGGPRGVEGDRGHQGVPTKPKVPIHVWIQGENYNSEYSEGDTFILDLGGFEDNLTDAKYQEGHLILLQNAHVYILEVNNDFTLYPIFLLSLQSYNSGDVVDGRPTYVHFAYSDNPDGEGLITDQKIKEDNITPIDKPYMGVCSNHDKNSPTKKEAYSWMKIQGATGLSGSTGPQGPQGPQGQQGEPGDNFTGHAYIIDLEGDMSTISLDVDGTRLHDDINDYCECIVHAYYGNDSVDITPEEISVILPDDYSYGENNKIINKDGYVGEIIKEQKEGSVKSVKIKFIPDETFKFPEKTIIFKIHVEAQITDNEKEYSFYRDTIWMVKGIVSPFELEIMPKRNVIKITDDNKYSPEFLKVYVQKVEGSKRDIFNFTENPDFNLLYKNYDDGDNEWLDYYDPKTPDISTNGIPTTGVVCLEFKVVRYCGSTDPEKPEEIWDYEDVWTIADGKSVHYYHGDLGSTESMMVLVTDETYDYVNSYGDTVKCAKLRNEPADKNGEGEGYSIIFDPKFFDGSEELTVSDVDIYNDNNDEYLLNESFARKIDEIEDDGSDGNKKFKFTVTRVPAGIDVIPMNFEILAYREKNGEIEYFSDTVGFNVYISSLSSTYTLVPTVSAFNTSTGKALKSDSLSDSDSDLDCDSIGCRVYKNNIEIVNLEPYGLNLKYTVYGESGNTKENITYDEPLIYGEDDDIKKDCFTASDVAIVFMLSYDNREIVRSTVPLIKDGQKGEDGNSWQYIFCRSNSWPFDRTGISNPQDWIDNDPKNPNNDLLGNDGVDDPNWTADPQGVGPDFRYEYQAYRKWNKDKKCWNPYGNPTLYSNYSVGGSSNSVNYKAILSNPVAIIPVGSKNSKTDENSDTQKDFTYVYFYDNNNDISTNDKFEVSIDENKFFEAKRDINYNNIWKVSFNPSYEENGSKKYFDFGENGEPFNLPITVKYTIGGDANNDGTPDFFETKVFWTLKPLYNKNNFIEDVELFVDKTVVDLVLDLDGQYRYKYPFRVGYYLTSNGIKNFIESKTLDDKGYSIYFAKNLEYLDKFCQGEALNNEKDVVAAYKENEYDWNNFIYDTFSFGLDADGNSDYLKLFTNSVFCIVALVDDINRNIIDYTTIHSTKTEFYLSFNDNVNENNGQTYYYFPSDNSSIRINPLYALEDETLIDFNLNLYIGEMNINNRPGVVFDVSLTSNNPGVNSVDLNPLSGTKNHFQLKAIDVNNMQSSKMRLSCAGIYQNNPYKLSRKSIYIELTKEPYELEINKGVLTRSASTSEIIGETNERLEIKVKRWDNKENDWKYLTNKDTFADTLGYACYLYPNDDYNNKSQLNKIATSINGENYLKPCIFYYSLSDIDVPKSTSYITLELIQDYKKVCSTLSKELLYIVDSNDSASAIHLELTQDHILLPSEPTNVDGTIYYKVHSSYQYDIQTQMILYNGDKIITSGIDYSFTVNEESVNSITVDTDANKENGKYYGTITIPADLIKSDTNIKCTATYNGVSYHKVLFVDLEETPYEMDIDKNILRRDVNSRLILDDTITAHVKYWDKGWKYTNKGEVFLKPYDIDPECFTKGDEDLLPSTSKEDFKRTLKLPNSFRQSSTPEFRIYYCIKDDNDNLIEVSSETLGVINSGKDGEDGTSSKCISSEIIGYALPINDSCPDITGLNSTNEGDYVGVEESKVWKPSIQYLYGDKNANEMVGTQIFILLKEKWQKENSNEETFYIYRTTVTLAGTQGIDGKSRVLFYLGSYYKGEDNTETPTLEGDYIYGHLTNLRCDYYIDENGDAWMRKGVEDGNNGEGVKGSKYGNPNSSYWEQSDKVGFLQAGAIHADMINAGSIKASNAFVSAIKSIEIDASKITSGTIDAKRIDADAIIGDTIEGKTIECSLEATHPANTDIKNIVGSNPKMWKLNSDGSGYLSSGNIYWDADGNLNLGGKNDNDINNDNINIHSGILNKFKEYPIVYDSIKDTEGNVLSERLTIDTDYYFKIGITNKIVITDPDPKGTDFTTIENLKNNITVSVYLTNIIKNMEDGDAVDLDYINSSNYTISIDTLEIDDSSKIKISIPIRKNNFNISSPLYSFKKYSRETGESVSDKFSEIFKILLLPNTMISLTILKKQVDNKNVFNIFIKNLADFIYTNSASNNLTCLLSKVPDFNNFPISYTKIFDISNNNKIFNLNINVINDSYGNDSYVKSITYLAKKITYDSYSCHTTINSPYSDNDYNSLTDSDNDYNSLTDKNKYHDTYYTEIDYGNNKIFNLFFNNIYYKNNLKNTLNRIFKIEPKSNGILKILIVIPMFNLTFHSYIDLTLKKIGEITSTNTKIYHTDFSTENFKTYNNKNLDTDVINILQSLLLQSPNATMDIQILLNFSEEIIEDNKESNNSPQHAPQLPQ